MEYYVMLQCTSLIILKQISLFQHDSHYSQKIIYAHLWHFTCAVILIPFLHSSILLDQFKSYFLQDEASFL